MLAGVILQSFLLTFAPWISILIMPWHLPLAQDLPHPTLSLIHLLLLIALIAYHQKPFCHQHFTTLPNAISYIWTRYTHIIPSFILTAFCTYLLSYTHTHAYWQATSIYRIQTPKSMRIKNAIHILISIHEHPTYPSPYFPLALCFSLPPSHGSFQFLLFICLLR